MAIGIHLFHVVFYCASLITATFDVEKKVKEPILLKVLGIKEKLLALEEEEVRKATHHLAPDRNLRDLTRRLSGNDRFLYSTEYLDDDCVTPIVYNAEPLMTCITGATKYDCDSSTVTEYEYADFSDCEGTSTETTRELEASCTVNGTTESCGKAPSNIVGEITMHWNDKTCGSDSIASVMAFAGGCNSFTEDGTAMSARASCENSDITMTQYLGTSCSGTVMESYSWNDMFENMTQSGSCATLMNFSFFGISLMVHVDVSCTPTFFVSDDDDDDDDEAPCFSGDDVLTLETGGSIRFSEVNVGDRILSANKDGAISFSDVVFLPHEKNQRKATFVEMTTSGNKQLHATKDHLMVTCEGETVAARSLTPGACLRTVDGDETLKTIKLVQKHGIYTAVTDNDYVVVGGIVASPFAINHDLVHAYYDIHRFVYDYFPALLKSTFVARANNWLGQISATVYGSLLGRKL